MKINTFKNKTQLSQFNKYHSLRQIECIIWYQKKKKKKIIWKI